MQLDDASFLISETDLRLERGASLLRWGALVNAALAALLVLAGLIASTNLIAGMFDALSGVLLTRADAVLPAGSGGDAALAAVIMMLLVNTSLFLVLMVGVLAREWWALPAIALLVILNLLAVLLAGFTPGVLTVIFALWGAAALRQELGLFRINPVMLKELRGRMRGVRAFAVLTVYLVLMSAFTILLYAIYSSVARSGASAAAGEVGRVLFAGVVGIELLLIVFIAPAFTAGAITSERERQTYDLLRTTLLASPSFVIGKLEAALSYIVLLLAAGIPLQSIAFLFGGVSETEVVLSLLILLVTAIVLGTIGIYFSAAMPRTLTASVRAYSIILGVMFIAPVILSTLISILYNFFFGYQGAPTSPLAESLYVYATTALTSVNPVATALSTQQLLVERQVAGFWSYTLSSSGTVIPMVSPWILFTIIYLAASAILIVFTIRQTRSADI